MAQVTIASSISSTDGLYLGPQRRLFFVDGNYYAIYLDAGDIWYKKSTDNGDTWGSAVQVNTDISTQYQPAGWLDGTDIHIVYHETSSDLVHHRILDTTTDTLGTEHSTADLGVLDSDNINLVTVDSGGRIYIHNSSDPDTLYSDDGGSSWTSITDANQDAVEQVSMVAEGTNLHFFQRDATGNDLEHLIYNGTTWAGPTVVYNGLINNANPIAADDGAGNIIVSFPGFNGSLQSEIKIFRYDGSWTEKTPVITGSPTGLQVWSNSVCVNTANGDIYAFYTYDADGTNDVAYYKKSTDDGTTWGSEVDTGFTHVASLFYTSALYSNGTVLSAVAVDATNNLFIFSKLTDFASTAQNSSKASIVQTRGTHQIIQNQDTNNVNSIFGGTGGAEDSQAWGQSFIANGTRITAVKAKFWKYNTPTDNVVCSITSTLGGSALATKSIAASSISAGSEVTFTFDTPATVTSGNTYYVEFSRDGVRDETNRMAIYIYFNGIFNGGVAQKKENNSWIVDSTGTDLRFTIYFEDLPQSVKANILRVESKANSTKASLFVRGNYVNSVKANILRTNETKINSVKSNIVFLLEQENSVKASINVTNTQANSVKANLFQETRKDNSVKANFYDIQRNTVKANITSPQTSSQSVKANIPADVYRNYSVGQIKMPPFVKQYEYRIYDDNIYVDTWVDDVVSEPSFRTIINGGASEMVIRLARNFDDFGEDEDVKLNNRVDVWCFDKETPNGQRIYRGYISGYRPIFEASNEYVEVTLLSYLAETSGIMVRGPDGSTQYAQNSMDPSDIMKNIINRYRSYGGTIFYTDDSIDTTNTTVSYTFETDITRDALDKVIELCPDGWYWYLDANANVQMHAKPSTATHVFRVGREIESMETWRRGEDIVNEVFFVGGGSPQMFRYYKNDGSIEAYGRRGVKKIDQRVTNTATADIMANRIINTKKDPEIRTRITVNDSNNNLTGYDIESINVGDTIQIGNLKQGVKTVTRWDVGQWDEDVWDQTLAYSAVSPVQILSIDYRPDQVILEASSRIPEITKRIEDINRNAETIVLVNNPSSPTDA